MENEERIENTMNEAEVATEAEPDSTAEAVAETTPEVVAEAEAEVTEEAGSEAEAEITEEAEAEAEPDDRPKAVRKAEKKVEKLAAKLAFMEAAMDALLEAEAEAEENEDRKAAKKAAKKAEKLSVEIALAEAVMESAEEALEKAEQKAALKAERKAAKAAAKAEKRANPDPVKLEIKELRARLAALQQTVREQGLPIIVLVEGWAAAGKGSLINDLISEIDPRNYNVTSPVITPEAKSRYPFLYPYAGAIPENGKIMFYDSGWMEDCVRKLLRREITKEEYKDRVRAVSEFERQLRDGGYVILKLFLDISESEQRKRVSALRENFETEWRVTSEDMWQLREHKTFR